ncbi:GNAT family N-acetyltransferase [Campylobacter magnus]|uniref:GNAT family N-acetyltransferase n=1 Tax=Campylobacter magnus TaxID=3026462 RepID=UPI00236256DA|nr:GNAT family N-acetyltransferase [Campylobacter magnus]MDD0856590.1 GNAT family N-acetyltransferase [Campylobacter magnus]
MGAKSHLCQKSHEGRGIAKMLLNELLDNARKQGIKIIPTCSYVAKVMKNDSYADLL